MSLFIFTDVNHGASGFQQGIPGEALEQPEARVVRLTAEHARGLVQKEHGVAAALASGPGPGSRRVDSVQLSELL